MLRRFALYLELFSLLLTQWGEPADIGKNWGERPEQRQVERVQRDRVILFYSQPAELVKLEPELRALRHNGWRIDGTETAHIQTATIDDWRHVEFIDAAATTPYAVMVHGGAVIRSLQTGCTTPIDRWSLGWLHNGQSARPTEKRLTATMDTSGRYPLRGSWWSVGSSWNASKGTVLRHLRTHPNHSGKSFQRWPLETFSRAELHSLHSDDHENRVQRLKIKTSSVLRSRPAICPT